MENQFEQNRAFNPSHNGNSAVTDTKKDEKRQLQGEEGNPNQKLTHRKELDRDEKELDRRPADVAKGSVDKRDSLGSSAIAGIQNDQQNSTEGDSRPLGEDPNHNAEIENKEDEDK